MHSDPELAVAVFSHNVSGTIISCLKSVLAGAPEKRMSIFVLANGCTDATENVVRNFQLENPHVRLISIPMADKANAWNYYVYKLAPVGVIHVFVDGDVEVEPGSLLSISETFHKHPTVNAVGGVPVAGRDRRGWTNRMISFGRVSGGLYALHDEFITGIRHNRVRLPTGLIGEDFLVSALAKKLLSMEGFYTPSPLLFIERKAGFYFRPLSLLRPADYLIFIRRLIRYRIRDYQLFMLVNHFNTEPAPHMPENVKQLYKDSRFVPRYGWRGRLTLIDWLAVFNIRRSISYKKSN